MIKIQHFHCQGSGVRSLVREIRSYRLGSQKKKKKNANPETPELYLWIHVWVFRTANAESKTQTIFILTDIAKTCTNLYSSSSEQGEYLLVLDTHLHVQMELFFAFCQPER